MASTQLLTQTYLNTGLAALRQLLHYRFHAHFGAEGSPPVYPKLPDVSTGEDALSRYVRHYNLSEAERWLILIVLAPHLVAGFYDSVVKEYLSTGGDFPEFGGRKSQTYRSFLPTGETILFLLAGNHPEDRVAAQMLLSDDSLLFRTGLLSLDNPPSGEPRLSGVLRMDDEFLEVFTTGRVSIPKMSTQFPAQRLQNEQEWEDLVLADHTRQELRDLENWLSHRKTLAEEWGMAKTIRPGYRALFYGPPGTGKTLTATLLGKATGKEVFRIDLSMVVSKYIGETEKNLARLFDKAEHKDWILFFDEADALFGKRTSTRDANDKYANQEVSFLLQRVETYSGLTILATNFKANIDEAFLRRFDTIVYFPLPAAQERLEIWQQTFPQAVNTTNIDLQGISQKYELTGGQIVNIVRFCCLELLRDGQHVIDNDLIIRGIKRELRKVGKF